GEVLGYRGLEVEVVVWDEHRDAFVLGSRSFRGSKGGKFKRRDALRIEFGLENRSVLVDFWGGKTSEGNVEALVWGPDGTLSVRNAHDDSARPRTPEERARRPRAAERLDRYDAWRARVQEARAQTPTGPIVMPKGKRP